MRYRGYIRAAALALLASASATIVAAPAWAAKDTLVLGMRLEPPGLDPTTGAAAAIAQITLYNVFEGLTRIDENAQVGPGLAESWTVSDDLKVYTFKLRRGVKFHDGTDFDAADVKFTYQRNAAEGSTNKRKKRFANMAAIDTPDANTVRITLKDVNPSLLFHLGESTAVIVGSESAETNATNPVGTGAFKFVKWVKGDSVTLQKADSYRDAGSIKLNNVTFKFVGDASAQVAALLAGDVDVFPILDPKNLAQFASNPEFVVQEGTTEGETILSTNNKRPALSDVRVRRAIAHAINRQEIIDGAMFGYGTPIGTHFAPHNPAYLDLTGLYPHDPEKAKALLKEAGYENGLELSLKLPPPAYARDGGQILAAQLAKVGIKVTIENVEWAQWLDVVYKKKNYDLTIVSHVEPMDINIYARKDYYFQYDNAAFRELIKLADTATDAGLRAKYLQAAQRAIAEDAVNGYIFQLAKTAVFKKGLKGIWKNSPMFVNDLSTVSWQE